MLQSSSTGKIKRLFLCAGKLDRLSFLRILLELFEKKSTHTQIVVCTYINPNTGHSKLETFLLSQNVACTMDLNSDNLDEILLIDNSQLRGADPFNEWVRDPFIVVYDENVIRVQENTIFNENFRCCPDPVSQNALIAESLREKKLIEKIEECRDCFCIAGGNILFSEGIVLVGGNEFKKMFDCLKSNFQFTFIQAKVFLAEILGVLPDAIFIIGYFDDASGKNSDFVNVLFGTEYWYNPLSLLNHPRIKNEITFEKVGISFKENFSVEAIQDVFKSFESEEYHLYDNVISDYFPSKEDGKKFKASLIELIEQSFVYKNFVHIDLFMTPSGYKIDEKLVVFLAKIVALGIDEKLIAPLNNALDDLEKEMKVTGKFDVRRNPVPCLGDKSNKKFAFYNNCIVENCNESKTVWLPDFVLESDNEGIIPYQIDNVNKWEEIGFKVRLIVADFTNFAEAQGALHCMTKDLRRF